MTTLLPDANHTVVPRPCVFLTDWLRIQVSLALRLASSLKWLIRFRKHVLTATVLLWGHGPGALTQ